MDKEFELFPVDELVERILTYNPKTNQKLIRDAYAYGRDMHEGQTRHSGEPYFSHPIEVACILTEQHLDDATIVTALLHDTIEDTKASYSEVAARFGDEVAMLVDGVTKLTNLQLSSSETKQAENFRKLFMAMSKDLRVILVKLADRLHNMRTIKAMRPDKQVQKARETMDIFAPLAGRMGMQWMREELEDLAFKVLNPEGRASIMRRFITLQKETGDVIERITGDMRGEFEALGIEAQVFGRAKTLFDLRKMQAKTRDFALRYLRVPYHHKTRLIVTAPLGRSICVGARCRGGSRIISASPNRTAIGRSIPRYRAATGGVSRFRSAPSRCMMSLNPVWRRIGPIRTVCAGKTRLPLIRGNGSTRLPSNSAPRTITTSSSRL